MNDTVKTLPETVPLPIPDALRIALLLQQGGLRDEAELLYRQVLGVHPDNLDALKFLSFICHRQKRGDEAAQLLERFVALDPLNADGYNNLGNVYETMDDSARAESLFRRAIELAPGHAEAHNNLGVILAEQGRFEEALEVYRKAVELAPATGEFSYNLGNVLRRMGRLDEAFEAYSAAVKATPEHFGSWQGLACTLHLSGQAEEAIQVFDELERLKPGDPIVAYLRAISLGQEAPERAPDDYVQHLFDDAADSFDRHLASLGYRAPSLVVEALAPVLGEPKGNLAVLDAGCGTGLCGPLLRPFAASLVGVDLSEGMLKRAAGRQVYDDLYKAELTRFLERSGMSFDLIVSADTLCYFGALEAVCAAAAGSLKAGGLFSFTVEAAAAEEAEFHLDNTGRYSHGKGYLQAALAQAGFQVVSFETVVLRNEGKQPVTGYLVLARKG